MSKRELYTSWEAEVNNQAPSPKREEAMSFLKEDGVRRLEVQLKLGPRAFFSIPTLALSICPLAL